MISIATELVTNALQHSLSGQPDGFVVIELTWYGPVARVMVTDGGGPSEPRLLAPYGEYGERGRGLYMVTELSARRGVTGDEKDRTCWADVVWITGPQPTSAELALYEHRDQVIATQEQRLAEDCPDWLTWYGRETLSWWGCPKHPGSPIGLVNAPSATALALQLTHPPQLGA